MLGWVASCIIEVARCVAHKQKSYTRVKCYGESQEGRAALCCAVHVLKCDRLKVVEASVQSEVSVQMQPVEPYAEGSLPAQVASWAFPVEHSLQAMKLPQWRGVKDSNSSAMKGFRTGGGVSQVSFDIGKPT